MSIGFELFHRTRTVFGAGALARVPDELSRFGAGRVLLVTDPGIVASGLAERLTKVLSDAGIPWSLYDKVSPNPTTTVIEAGAVYYTAQGCSAVIGLGGGSSIDTAKGIGILAVAGGRIADYAGNARVKVPPAPVLAIPTTAGTGAEVSTSVAITDEERHSKFAVRSPLVPPAAAVLDPALLVTLPSRIAAETAMDTLCHLIEAYVSKGANTLMDLFALEGIRRCGRWLTAFVANRANPEAAENMLYAAMLGGIVISYARTGGAHTLTRPLGDTVSHGLANAIVLPYVMEFNLIAAPSKFVQVAEALGYPVQGAGLEHAAVAIAAVRRINRELGIPERLRDVGVAEERIPELARLAFELEISKLNPRDLGVREIEALFHKAW